VLVIGPHHSPLLQASCLKTYHVYYNGWNVVTPFLAALAIVKSERPDVLHLFDSRIDFFARAIGVLRKIPMIFTKCGGPSPRRFFPAHGNLVVYSREDVDWFSRQRKYADSSIQHIPNRISNFNCDGELIAAMRARIGMGVPIVLRISRFCKHYEKSMIQGIELVNRLNEDGVRCKLVIVGAVQEQDSHERVASMAGAYVHIITEDKFTKDAKSLIDGADLVIGTGRGFMEAASRGKVLLTPLVDGGLPLLVTPDNFDSIFATNFSPRNRVEGYDEEANYATIRKVLQDPDYRGEMEALARILNKHFSIDGALETYNALYRELRYERRWQLLDLVHGVYKAVQSYRVRGTDQPTKADAAE
jgi:glycosyltransferase involved in cell wall biosynthesis